MEIGKSVKYSVNNKVYNLLGSPLCWSTLLSVSSTVLNLVRGFSENFNSRFNFSSRFSK